MKLEESVSIVREIMAEYAKLTGLSPVMHPPKRYLWTDAFALCNFLGLYRETEDEAYRDLARRLIMQVHDTLGRHHPDDLRKGWISGLSEEEGKRHPAIGGLRIGKKLNERPPHVPLDERLEWDRDGQYLHYLTKWMHALNRASKVIDDFTFNRWAMELAKTAHAHFVYTVPSLHGRKRMYWKMSIDLSYPLISSMGHHDPLDGYITYSQLQATGKKDPERPPGLANEIADMANMCKEKDWATDDPLGIGGLLSDAYRAAQLIVSKNLEEISLPLALLKASLTGLAMYTHQDRLKSPATRRLAFRELGLSIGLGAVENLSTLVRQNRYVFAPENGLYEIIEDLMDFVPVKEGIEEFWLRPASQATESWSEHREINLVMLATSLAPHGFLTL